jgi:hypothetical protein
MRLNYELLNNIYHFDTYLVKVMYGAELILVSAYSDRKKFLAKGVVSTAYQLFAAIYTMLTMKTS